MIEHNSFRDSVINLFFVILVIVITMFNYGCVPQVTYPDSQPISRALGIPTTEPYPQLTEQQRTECYATIIDSDLDKVWPSLSQLERLNYSIQLISECER